MVMNWTFGTGSDAFPSESGLPARTEEREEAWGRNGWLPPVSEVKDERPE